MNSGILQDIQPAYRVLALDDDANQGILVQKFLAFSGPFQVDPVCSVKEFWERIQDHPYDLILLDYRLKDTTGIDVLQDLRGRNFRQPVLMVTGQGDERIAVQAIQHGAYDYVVKDGDYLASLPALIKKAVEVYELTLSVERSNEQIRYQSILLNNMRDAVVVWDMQGRITFWNAAAYILYGATPQERLGEPVEETYLGTFNPRVRLPLPGSTSSQEVERQYRGPDGSTTWISSRIMVLYDPNNSRRPLGYMDVTRNITRRKLEQQALNESEARYRAIVEDYQTEMICRFLWDGRLTFVNEAFCKYYQKRREVLLGENFLAHQEPGNQASLLKRLHLLSPEKPVCSLQSEVTLADGSVHWQEWTNRAIFDGHGRFMEFQAVGRDITARKKMELQVQAAQTHLAQAARLSAIGELASSVAHLINNPLTTVIAEAQMLIQEHRGDPALVESARAIEEAGWRAQQVIQQLLEFSRPNQDVQEIVLIDEALQKAVKLISPTIFSMGLSVELNLESDGQRLYGNPRQIEDLWVNLLLSMRDSLSDGNPHKITIHSFVAQEGWITVEIADDGTPIPLEQLETIFEPSLISPMAGRGTGMELAICREIVRQHKGKINAINVPGQGTTFRVEFPVEG